MMNKNSLSSMLMLMMLMGGKKGGMQGGPVAPVQDMGMPAEPADKMRLSSMMGAGGVNPLAEFLGGNNSKPFGLRAPVMNIGQTTEDCSGFSPGSWQWIQCKMRNGGV